MANIRSVVWKILKASAGLYVVFCTYIVIQFSHSHDQISSTGNVNLSGKTFDAKNAKNQANNETLLVHLLNERAKLIKERNHMIDTRNKHLANELGQFNQIWKDRDKKKQDAVVQISPTPMPTPKSTAISELEFPFEAYFDSWRRKVKPFCDRQMLILDEKLTYFSNISLNISLAHAQAKGGEAIKDAMNRSEADEIYSYKSGFFSLRCKEKLATEDIVIKGEDPHLKVWKDALVGSLPNELDQTSEVDTQLTIAINRYEYANVYWALMDIYNAYLITKFFKKTPSDVQILILDAHPFTPMDTIWSSLFSRVIRPTELARSTTFRHFIWPYSRVFSPMLANIQKLPLIVDFRIEILYSLGIYQNHKLQCNPSPSLSVLFIWRRDYLAHPRNPSGRIPRKISNEDELLSAAKAAFPSFNIKGVQLDQYTAKEQLEMIASSDIFIGMHGAAHALSPFLPKGSAVVELFPKEKVNRKDPRKGFNWHMEYLARWSGHYYYRWVNEDAALEDERLSTRVPVEAVTELLRTASEDVCSGKGVPVPPPPHSVMGGSYKYMGAQ